ncbi:hypothetical protein HAX54_052590, partial [Datura stramonium]|nr:hypothetical protein [Datura stramonium]
MTNLIELGDLSNGGYMFEILCVSFRSNSLHGFAWVKKARIEGKGDSLHTRDAKSQETIAREL